MFLQLNSRSCFNTSAHCSGRKQVKGQDCFVNDCIIAKKLRMLLGMPLDGTAATVLLDVHLVILLLMRGNYEV